MNSNYAPKQPENRPGLPQLAYRITDYTSTRKRLLSLLRDSLRLQESQEAGPLAKLTIRADDDPAIALLDAWAVVVDVLTFYQERIANEGYLQTATERRSILELARMIGYELNPGVAASTYLVFTVEDAPGSPDVATIPKGTQVMSIPAEDELPQTFESSEEFIAHVIWNNLKPRPNRPQKITSETRQLYIKGVNTRLQPGDFLFLVEQIDESTTGRKYLLPLTKVETNTSEAYTLAIWKDTLPDQNTTSEQSSLPLENPQIFAFQQQVSLFGHNFSPTANIQIPPPNPPTTKPITLNDFVVSNLLQPNLSKKQIDLDNLYPKIIKGGWLALYDARNSNKLLTGVYQTKNIFSSSRVENLLFIFDKNLAQTRKITSVELDSFISIEFNDVDSEKFNIRSTIILAQSELLELAPEPLNISDLQAKIFEDPIQGKTVFLSEFIPKLQPNQTVIVSGQCIRAQLNDIGGVFALRKQSENISWEKINNGLTNSQVRSLAVNSEGTLFAGTTKGIFIHPNEAKHWEPLISWESASQKLEKKEIQVLLIPENSNLIVVGTANGIFRYEDKDKKWEEINQQAGLGYTDIRALIYRGSEILAGTINGGVFKSINDGKNWLPTGLNNTDVQTLATQGNYIFAGTIRDGIFRTTDGGSTWQQITNIRQGKGTITTEGTGVFRHDTNFSTQRQLDDVNTGDIINANGQSRTVLAISSDKQELTIDRPFRPDLTVNTSFNINTGLTNKNFTVLAVKQNYIFAGTAGSGVFRSENNGDRWIAVNTNLIDLEIRCLTVHNEEIWVGTSQNGVFCSTNNGDTWDAINPNLTNLDVRAILPPTESNSNFFVAGIGILQPPEGLSPKPIQRGDIVQILEPPVSIPDKPNNYLWKVIDKDGFPGDLITTTGLDKPEFKNELTLLPALKDSEMVSETAVIQIPPTDQQSPILTLQEPLKYAYDTATVNIYANLVQATHGETVEEVLGSGDGSTPNERFMLKKPPLTYVAATNARGSESTLEVRVNGILWQEVPSLYPLKPYSENYIIRIQNDGKSIVTFGDGSKGARLPSGQENVTATYRSGIGLEGNLAAEQLSLLKTRPLGVAEVINPLAATGGAPRESLEEARAKAPPTVRTLDRIVSIRDFEDFAQGFAGIGKAQAVPLWNGESQLVHITIAAVKGSDVPKDSQLYTKLVEAIDNARDPIQQVQVDSYQRLLFNVEARLLLDARYQTKLVQQDIHETLNKTFAFEQRRFAQEVTAAEVIAAIQTVKGVVAVDLDALYQLGQSKALKQTLPALPARYDPQISTIYPAQLLRLNPEGIQLTVVTTL
ncbi:putative baseplate assembly protein [Nostoc sp. WHI]|uniref:putative baseplate assembly protein n=1 Tax=Nostoc sp. WHI TaxID=2650611 RepID=UPI0018C59F6A|nr:putative baseplate assembly protein [Nostoc sp. WHI]MBG1267329.1 putative baseplate assembly protein [Nostoc sp. WHI]